MTCITTLSSGVLDEFFKDCVLSPFPAFFLSNSSVGKESVCSAGDPGSIPGSGRSAGEGISHSSILGLPLWLSW